MSDLENISSKSVWLGWRSLLSVLALLAVSGCASNRYPLVTLSAVSMTERSLPAGAAGQAVGEVETTFCTGDDAITTTDASVGLMDEAIMIAQKEHGADYITDAQFFAQDDCVVLTGTAMKASSSSPPSDHEDGGATAE